MLDFGLQNFDPLGLWTSGFRPPWTLDFGILTPWTLDFGSAVVPRGGARLNHRASLWASCLLYF